MGLSGGVLDWLLTFFVPDVLNAAPMRREPFGEFRFASMAAVVVAEAEVIIPYGISL